MALGTWGNEPFLFAYQWQRCSAKCTPIEGATAASYKPVGADVGSTLVVGETATNGSGSTSASSKPTSAIAGRAPVEKLPPTIDGAVQQGRTLTEVHGSWTNEPSGYLYQWRRCNSAGKKCKAISGATAHTYTPTATDVGATIEVTESAFNATATGSPAASAPTVVVPPAAPVNIVIPTVTGIPARGHTLSEHAGAWTNSPTHLSVLWLRCEAGECHPIEGATGSSYTVTAADAGYAIAAREAAGNAGGWNAAISLPTSPVSGRRLRRKRGAGLRRRSAGRGAGRRRRPEQPVRPLAGGPRRLAPLPVERLREPSPEDQPGGASRNRAPHCGLALKAPAGSRSTTRAERPGTAHRSRRSAIR